MSNTYFLKNKLVSYGKVFLFNQNNKYLAGVDNKNRIKLWNRTSFTSSQSINLKIKDPIKSIALLTNDLLAIGKCVNNKIEIWNISNQSSILSLNDHEDCVNALLSINISSKTFLLSGSADKTIRLYDSQFRNIQTLREHKGSVLALDYNPQP